MKDNNEYKIYRYWSPSGKSYIGQTKKKLEYRAGRGGSQYRSCSKFNNAIKAYSWAWFESHREILKDNLTKEEADHWERYYIKVFDSIRNGYNLQPGGYTNSISSLTKAVVAIDCDCKEVQFFDSITQASKEVGMNPSNISSCLRKNHADNKKHYTSARKIWLYHQDWDRLSREQKEVIFDSKPRQVFCRRVPVLCVTTGVIYESVKAAAKSVGIDPKRVSKCLRGENSYTTAPDGKRYSWEYASKESQVCQ